MNFFGGAGPQAYDRRRAEALAESCKRIEANIKIGNDRLKQLREERKKQQEALYNYMERLGVNEINGVKKSKIRPKPKITAADKKAKAVEYLESQGYRDAERLFDNIKRTQRVKYILGEESLDGGPGDIDVDGNPIPTIVYVDDSDETSG